VAHHNGLNNGRSPRPQLGPALAVAPADAILGLALALGLAATTLLLLDSWGGTSWVLDAAAGAVVSVLAVIRRRHRLATAIAGLAVTAAAIACSVVADLPAEPGPTTSLALAVLLGSAIRGLRPASSAALVGGGGLVVAAAWLVGSAPIGVWSSAAWLGALVVGLALRLSDAASPAVPRYGR
jgi:hypothetical protein